MAIALVSQGSIAGVSGASPATITYSSTAGHTLIIAGHLFDNDNGAFVAPTSITDTGGNVWQVSTTATQAALTTQTPPLCSITSPSDGPQAHFANWVAWSVGAKAVTSVTIAFEGGVSTFQRISLSEWTGIAQFDNSWASGSTTGTTSVTSGPVTLSVANELVVGALSFGGAGTETIPAGWTAFGAGGGTGYFFPFSVSGSYSPVWTVTAAGAWTGALAVFSPVQLVTSYSMRTT